MNTATNAAPAASVGGATQPTNPPEEMLAVLRAARQVAIIGHVTPDADCLGSMGGLALALRERGAAPRLALPDGTVARKLQFLLDDADLRPASAAQLRGTDLAVVLDTAKDRRVNLEGKLEALAGVPVMNVDHHATNPGFGRWNWVDAGRSSTAEMVHELVVALGAELTPTLATLLYAGLHSDTRGFSLPNTTPRSLAVAHALAAAGARVAECCERLTRSQSPGEFALLGMVYRNTRTAAAGRLAWTTLSHAEIAQTGCDANAIDDQVEIPRSMAGVRVAICFSEANRGKVRLNFRGDGGVSVLALAQQFGGGGHEASAGAILDGDVTAVVERVIPAATAFAEALGER